MQPHEPNKPIIDYKNLKTPIKFNLSHFSSDSEYDSCIRMCVKYLIKNKVIALPTDTVYGLACLPSSVEAIEKIYNMKGRNMIKPVALSVSDFDTIYRLSDCSMTHDELSLFLPGKCTLVFKRLPQIYSHLNPGIESIGFRIPEENFVVRLCSLLPDKSLVLTSANVSNTISTIIPQEFSELNNCIDIIVDKGYPLSNDGNRLGSTVIDLTRPNHFQIIRSGSNLNYYKNILVNILRYKEF